MAQMLFGRDSTDRHLRAARLDARRARRAKGAETFAERITPGIGKLCGARGRRQDAQTVVEDARDDVVFEDLALDDEVRTTHEQAAQHDRLNPGAGTLAQLFRDDGFTPITGAPRDRESDLMEQLVADLRRLPDDHPLRLRIEPLQGAVVRVRAAAAGLREALRALGTVRGEEEFEQQALRKQYEANYLDARKTLGRAAAERLFAPFR